MTVYAAWRDASWCRSPGRARVYHVNAGEWMGACKRRWLILNEDSCLPAGDVPAHLRCRRPGCRVRWPAIEGGSRG